MNQSQRSFEYRADLAETTLPEMLYTVDRFQVPGVLRVRRGDGDETVVKKVFLREGNVVHATSTDRRDSLGAYLQRTGQITAEQFATTMDARSESEKRYGELLVERGLISPAGIYRAIRQQVESIVWSLFYWEDGEVLFEIGAPPDHDAVRIQRPICQVILQGIQRAPNAKALLARLGRKETVFESCYRTEDLIPVALDDQDYALLRLVDGERTLYDICTRGPRQAPDNAKLLYAFRVLGLIRPRQGPVRPAGAEKEGRGERRGVKIRLDTPGGRFGRSDSPKND